MPRDASPTTRSQNHRLRKSGTPLCPSGNRDPVAAWLSAWPPHLPECEAREAAHRRTKTWRKSARRMAADAGRPRRERRAARCASQPFPFHARAVVCDTNQWTLQHVCPRRPSAQRAQHGWSWNRSLRGLYSLGRQAGSQPAGPRIGPSPSPCGPRRAVPSRTPSVIH